MRTNLTNHQHNLYEILPAQFTDAYDNLSSTLLRRPVLNRGRWQGEDVSMSVDHQTHEVSNVILNYMMPATPQDAQLFIEPDLPWAEDHFTERVGGEPLNPAPSYVDWPYHSRTQAERFVREGGTFDHTYPERMWPKRANPNFIPVDGREAEVNFGIRYAYGDLQDVVDLLRKDLLTRQAYLPIWFPEDTGAVQGQRVPCTLGYHFIVQSRFLHCFYAIRSCDIYRHFRNDVYLAVRLTQWIRNQVGNEFLKLGYLNMTISNLHLLQGDAWHFNTSSQS